MKTTVQAGRERAVPRWSAGPIREQILACAARAFVRRGVGAATVRDIAREAGCTAGSLYTYFKGKEELVTALRDHLQTGLLATFAVPTPGGLGFRQRLESLLTRQFEFMKRHGEALMLLAGSEHSQGDKPGSPHRGKYLKALQEWFGREARPGDLGTYSAVEAAPVLVGIAMTLFGMPGSASKVPDSRSVVPRLLDLFFHGVRGAKTK